MVSQKQPYDEHRRKHQKCAFISDSRNPL